MALVGEQGPELVNLPRGSDVHPTNETKDILSSMGVSITIENMNVRQESDIDKLAKKLGFSIQNAPLYGLNG